MKSLVAAVLVIGATSVGVAADQRGRQAPPVAQLAGTYDLETTRGDNPQQAADAATRNVPPGQRDRIYRDLMARLQPPATLSIDRQGRTVTISSSNAPRVTFDADGRTRNEQMGRRTTATRADLSGDRLTVSSRGNRNTDFMVTFEPLNRGDELLVTREMDSDDLRRPVTIRSYYRRVAGEPRWDLYGGGNSGGGYRSGGPARNFIVPEGTRLSAVLDSPISARTSRDGERFTMTVTGPGEYRDARIDGIIERVTNGNGRNQEMRVNFDRIRLRDGRSAEFEGVLNTVRLPNGQTPRVAADDARSNDTQKTVEGGAIGAAFGAIIGAIAGGGKGAAIGGVAGALGGAIIANNSNQALDLPPGTEVTLTVTWRQ